ncbi:hypothetical protein OG373_34980 [Streptomyces avidinii]|uniref:hypothetical protein n=1 Tax=Streptomyces avidinii TaxID=1895 RepID=UPI00386AA976|nr:hypothetical protein OG373_34980 [Streptomyces avidinii]
MQIPLWGTLALLALAALQLAGSLRSSWAKARSGEGGAERTDARLDLADGFAGAVLLTGLAFGQIVVALCGLAVQGPILTAQLIRGLLRRRAQAAGKGTG